MNDNCSKLYTKLPETSSGRYGDRFLAIQSFFLNFHIYFTDIQEVFHVYFNKFEIAVTHLFLNIFCNN